MILLLYVLYQQKQNDQKYVGNVGHQHLTEKSNAKYFYPGFTFMLYNTKLQLHQIY